MHPEVVHVPVAPSREAVKNLLLNPWVFKPSGRAAFQWGSDGFWPCTSLPFPAIHPLFGSAFPPACPAQPRGSVLGHFAFAAEPPCRRNWLTQRWCSLCREVLGWLWLQQAAGRSCSPSSSFSELLHCWISEQWGWAELLLQWYLCHGLIQASVAATFTETALHNRIAVGNLSFSLVSSSDFFCVQGIYLETWWFCWVTTCVQLFPAWVCESLITSLLDKQDGEGINSAWHVTVPAVGYELAEPVIVSWGVLHPSIERCTRSEDHNVAEASGGCSVFTFTTTGTKHSNALLPVHTSDCAGALVNETTIVPV